MRATSSEPIDRKRVHRLLRTISRPRLWSLLLCAQYPRMPGKIEDRRRQRELRDRAELLSRRLLLRRTDLDDQMAAGQQPPPTLGDQAIEDDEPTRPALQRLVRLIIS